MVFVGPSGCGKSTALRMVAGLEDITEGEMRIGDRVVNGLHPRQRDVAMVFQNYALYPHMTVDRNIAFALKVRKMPPDEIKRRVEEAARILGLTPELKRKPAQLSGGQRQRVAMGRAIVRDPQVFLMDEPLSNLDAKLRVQMRAEISRIQHELGATTIYVTHDQIEAMTMGDRVAVLRKGELQQVAAPQQLYDRPANLFVASFIGSPEMNLVEAGSSGRTAGSSAGSRARHSPYLRRSSGRGPPSRATSARRSVSASGPSSSRTQRSSVTCPRGAGSAARSSRPSSSARSFSPTSRSRPRLWSRRRCARSARTSTAHSSSTSSRRRAHTGRS